MVVAKRRMVWPLFLVAVVLVGIIAVVLQLDESAPVEVIILMWSMCGIVMFLSLFDIIRVKKALLFDSSLSAFILKSGFIFKPKERIIQFASIERLVNIEPTADDKSAGNATGCLFGAIGAAIFVATNKNTRQQGIYIHFYNEKPLRLSNISKQRAVYANLDRILREWSADKNFGHSNQLGDLPLDK